MSGLTDFQVQVARIFFALSESAGFLVAGGAALIAQELVDRETRDLDLFAAPRPSVTTAVEAFESALTGHGWTVTRTQDGAQFVRLLVHGTEDEIVDIGVDSAPPRTSPTCWPSSPPGASSCWARHRLMTTPPSMDPMSRTPPRRAFETDARPQPLPGP